MKIGIITHHDVHNHGAQLQLYALIKVLNSLGHTASALSYTKSFDFLDDYATNKYRITLKSIPYYLNYVSKKGVSKTLFNVKKKSILDKFRDREKLVKGYYSRANDLSCVFIGSDEVFSIESGLNTFFWGMGVPSKNIFSYAGSFGPTTYESIIDKYAKEFIIGGINRFNKLSVRDKNSHDIIYKLTGKTVPIVCDPVILYGFVNEVKDTEKPLKTSYMLIYSYDNNMNDENEIKQIVSYARLNNLKTVSAGFYHKWCDLNINVSPIELINYVKHAECVVTDTFHGSVLSIIMNCPFVAKIRGNRNKLAFLLEEYGLSDREIYDFNDISALFSKRIEFDKVNHLIQEKRQQSIEYILECLEYTDDN